MFVMPIMSGFQASCLQDGRHNTQKENTLKKYNKQDFISITEFVTVTPILKIVRSLFQTFHLDGFNWF